MIEEEWWCDIEGVMYHIDLWPGRWSTGPGLPLDTLCEERNDKTRALAKTMGLSNP